MESLLDNIYGTLFLPDVTFRSLRQEPVVGQAVLVVAFLNVMDQGRRSGFEPGSLIGGMVGGLLGWVVLTALLFLLAYCFERNASFKLLLTLTGFAGLPWLLLGPAQALGGVWGALVGVAAMGWFCVWQVRAAAIALDVAWWRLVWILPLTFVGFGLSIGWLSSTIVAVSSLA